MSNNSKDNRIYTGKELTEELNEERRKQGKYTIQEINPGIGGSTGTYARKDKSFANAFDFFIKLVKREKESRG